MLKLLKEFSADDGVRYKIVAPEYWDAVEIFIHLRTSEGNLNRNIKVLLLVSFD